MRKRVARVEVAKATAVTPGPDDRLRAMSAASGAGLKGSPWKPARQVLTHVRAVPTIFPHFDHASGIGGLPLQRYTLVHGESSKGKTKFALGLELSFLERYHYVFHVDAEMTTAIDWCESLMARHADSPNYFALRPKSYEETADAVRRAMVMVGNARASGKLHEDVGGLVVVDSLRKLVPKGLLDKLFKEGAAGSLDGMKGRGAQVKAALNGQWLDELVPLMHDTNCGLVLIAREIEDVEADANDRKYGRDFKIGGGKAVVFDASLGVRVSASWIYDKAGEDREVIGERHTAGIWKMKVAGKDEKVAEAYFHTSNGKLSPEGFDRPRDVFRLGRILEVVSGEGGRFKWRRNNWHGEEQAVRKLHDFPNVMVELEAEVRAASDAARKKEEATI